MQKLNPSFQTIYTKSILKKPAKQEATGKKRKPSTAMSLVAPIPPKMGKLGDYPSGRQLLVSWSTSKPYGPCSCRCVRGRVRPSKMKNLK